MGWEAGSRWKGRTGFGQPLDRALLEDDQVRPYLLASRDDCFELFDGVQNLLG
jgi:hypothetical protein